MLILIVHAAPRGERDEYNSDGCFVHGCARAGLNRCGKSCRLRWLNYLRPDIKHGGYTEEEDRIIWSLYSSIGSRWVASH